MKWCDGVVVVYSTTSKSSLAEARAYLKHINIQCRTSGISLKPIILVGNKADLEHLRLNCQKMHIKQYLNYFTGCLQFILVFCRHVSYKDGKQLADSFGSLFHECSAAGSLHDVESAFQVLIRAVQQDRMLSSTATSIASHSDLRSLTGSLPKAFLRTKSGKSTSPKLLKKSSSTLKLFNKSFKFFT